MKFLKQKKSKFDNITNILFETQEKKKLLKLVFLMLIGMSLELFGVGLIFPALKLLTDNEFLSKTYNFFNIDELDTKILLLSIVSTFIIFFGFKNLFLWIVLKKYSSFLAQYEANLQFRLFKGYLNKSVSYFKEKNSSNIIINIKEISSFFSAVYLNSLLNLLVEIILQSSILFLLFYFSWQSTLIISILFGSLSIAIFSYNKKKLEDLGKLRNELSQSQLLNVQQGIGGIKEIKLLGREAFFLNNFEKNTNTLADANIKNAIISGSPKLIIEFFAVCSVSVIIFLFLFLGKSLIEILPVLGLFLVAAYKMVPSFNKILLMMNRIKFSTDMVDKIIVLANEFNLDELNQIKNEKLEKISFKKEIVLKDIFFKYPNRQNTVLENVNLLIKKNSFIGISGESGSGKSTLIDIIMGIVKPNKGSIEVDGLSIDDSIKDWQKQLGYVSQNIYLLPDTIKNNIAFGIPEDQIDDDLVNEVIKKTSLKKFVDSLELGINTFIGEGGALISGGQKQRIGIARALYNQPKILIFDEATNALDLEIEKQILNEISLLKNEFTLIFITHKESSIKYCDQKYLINNKNISKINSD
jgi:ATP-binding cassette, subfamily B, bacterial PglK